MFKNSGPYDRIPAESSSYHDIYYINDFLPDYYLNLPQSTMDKSSVLIDQRTRKYFNFVLLIILVISAITVIISILSTTIIQGVNLDWCT